MSSDRTRRDGAPPPPPFQACTAPAQRCSYRPRATLPGRARGEQKAVEVGVKVDDLARDGVFGRRGKRRKGRVIAEGMHVRVLRLWEGGRLRIGLLDWREGLTRGVSREFTDRSSDLARDGTDGLLIIQVEWLHLAARLSRRSNCRWVFA
ncbi:hypothetical protein CALCODRAFT_281665 [Calocera cornea HHB12733]|uniref:Uncharacterized protein n=1 Tax=Calocera cornea HHB12733 TaxID=1353952 RepID=A0A165G185_9BASI|nr:hypothetical protein CALCODRAFT_281665 [Calocera cornea HHB12733]